MVVRLLILRSTVVASVETFGMVVSPLPEKLYTFPFTPGAHKRSRHHTKHGSVEFGIVQPGGLSFHSRDVRDTVANASDSTECNPVSQDQTNASLSGPKENSGSDSDLPGSPARSEPGPEILGPHNDLPVWSFSGPGRALILLHQVETAELSTNLDNCSQCTRLFHLVGPKF